MSTFAKSPLLSSEHREKATFTETASFASDESSTRPTLARFIPPKSRLDGLKYNINNWWIWEVLAWITSAFFLAVVVGVVYRYNGQPLPQWPWGITLNAFIALFATISKAAMVSPLASAMSQLRWLYYSEKRSLRHFPIFDAAGRQPWAAFRMFFAIKRIHLSLLGALIVILSIAVDPFIQQIVTYPYKPVHLSNATIPWAQNFSGFSSFDQSFGAGPSETQAMMGAIYGGMFFDPRHQQDLGVAFSCPSGNCTWPQFSSLAVCQKCANITDKLEMSERKETHNNAPKKDTKARIFTLPNGLELNAASQWIVAAGDREKLLVLRNEGITLSTLSTIKEQGTGRATSDRWVTAEECILYFCINTYQAHVQNGVLHETILSTWHNTSTYQSSSSSSDPTLSGSDWSGSSGYSAPQTGPDSSQYPAHSDPHNDGYATASGPDSHGSSSSSSYSSNAANTYSVATSGSSGELAAAYTPPHQVGHEEITYYSERLSILELEAFFYHLWTGVWNITSARLGVASAASAPPLYALYYRNASDIFERLAKSMTSSIRQHTDQGGQIVGNSTVLVPHVQLQGLWLILPISLQLLTLIFLVSTMVVTSRSSVPVWKDSTLPILRLRLAGDAGAHLDTCDSLTHMEKLADACEVQFRHSDSESTLAGTMVSGVNTETHEEP